MVEETREAHALLLATAEDVLPLLAGVPTALAVGEVTEAGFLEDMLEIVLGLALLAHVVLVVGVDDLVAEGADAEVGALGEEHDAVLAGLLGAADEASIDGPEAGEDSRDGRFSDTVGARYLISY